jgi:hypothetical protein
MTATQRRRLVKKATLVIRIKNRTQKQYIVKKITLTLRIKE